MNIVSRDVAIEKKLKRFFTGKPCKHGHVAERYTTDQKCCECKKLENQNWNSNNRQKVAEDSKRWRKYNPEKRANQNKRYNLKNKEKISTLRKKTYEDNKEQVKQKSKERYYKNKDKCKKGVKLWLLANKDQKAALNAKYRAAKLQRTPPWLTQEHLVEIKEFYLAAQSSADDLQVDHIIPLQGEQVSGLHVPWNLQIIEASANQRKGNRFPI